MKVFFIAVAVGLSGEPTDLVVESLLAGTGEFRVFPVGQQSVESPANGLSHLFEAVDAGGL